MRAEKKARRKTKAWLRERAELKSAMAVALRLGGIVEMDRLWVSRHQKGGHELRREVIEEYVSERIRGAR